MATGVVLQVGTSCLGAVSCAAAASSSSGSQSRLGIVHQLPSGFLKVKRLPLLGLVPRSEGVKALSSKRSDAFEEPSACDWEMEERGPGEFAAPQSLDKQEISPEAGAIVLSSFSSSSSSSTSLQSLSKDAAMGIILSAAGMTAGWTTGSGLEGPAYSMNEAGSEMPGPIFSKSPRRRMRVAFTCNVCGHRSIRAINPRAYTDGTVFVQCEGCDVFHKLVDNLKLFHELKGRIYRGYECMEVGYDQYYDFLG